VKTLNLLCAGNKVFVKYQAQGGGRVNPNQTLTLLVETMRIASAATLLCMHFNDIEHQSVSYALTKQKKDEMLPKILPQYTLVCASKRSHNSQREQ